MKSESAKKKRSLLFVIKVNLPFEGMLSEDFARCQNSAVFFVPVIPVLSHGNCSPLHSHNSNSFSCSSTSKRLEVA